MNNKQIGTVVAACGLAMGILIFLYYLQLSALTDQLMIESEGLCFTETGECIHENYGQIWLTPIGAVFSLVLLGTGVFLFFSRPHGKPSSRFDIMLQALSDDEQAVIRKVKEEEGITQATLKYRTGLSKTKLSFVLKDLEKKGLVAKEAKGNTYKIFLGKK